MTSPTLHLSIPLFLCLFLLCISSDQQQLTSDSCVSTQNSCISTQDTCVSTHDSCVVPQDSFHSQVQDMNSKLARLELQLERIDEELYLKNLHIEKRLKKIEELNLNIQQLESDLSTSRDGPDYDSMINMFEEQVRELEAGVKKNDLDIRLLKLKAKDDEKSVNSLASRLELMAKVVPELWFHVQKLEQAREVIERRTVELRRHLQNQRCSFFKFINKFPERHYVYKVASYTFEVFVYQLRWSCSALKKYHHQLQGFFSQEMKKNKLTAGLAYEEFVFILVSIVFVFPVFWALKWLLSVILTVSSAVIFLFMLALRLLSMLTLLAFAVAIYSLFFAMR